jgi:hypothetical protein
MAEWFEWAALAVVGGLAVIGSTVMHADRILSGWKSNPHSHFGKISRINASAPPPPPPERDAWQGGFEDPPTISDRTGWDR